jgi:hypothetical protein
MDTIAPLWRKCVAAAERHPRLAVALGVTLPLLVGIKWYAMGTYCKAWGDMTGKVVAVTGANCGIGYETALKLAKLGASVLLICRDQARGEKALNSIKAASKNGLV